MSKLDFIHAVSVYIVVMFLIINMISCSRSDKVPEPPTAERIDTTLTMHGDTRVDPYFWLNQRDNPQVLDYLKAENAYRKAVLKPVEKLQKKLYQEMIGRIKQDDKSVPYLDNGYYYYWRYEKGAEYRIYARKKELLETEEEILLNVPEMAGGFDYFDVSDFSISNNNRYLAWGVDTLSRRKYTLYFKDLTNNEQFPERILNTTGHPVWANDNRSVFYTLKDSTLRAYKVLKHVLGTDPADDVEIYTEKDNTYSVHLEKTRSKKYIIIGSYQTLSTEMRLIDADHPDKPYHLFQPRERDHEYHLYHHDDRFYIRTNWNAENFKLMQTKVGHTSKDNWQELIPVRKSVLLEDVTEFRNYLVLGERKKGLRQIRIINLGDESEHYIDFEEDAYVAFTTSNHQYDTDVLRYMYTSLTTPFSTFDYHMKNRWKTLLKQEKVGGGFEQENYRSERHWVIASDGTLLPISMVYKKGMERNGENPLLLFGYGSYGYSMDPYFSSSRLSLLDRGFIFAIAHIRGGAEMGRRWYEEGKLLNKKNTFTDFIACAEYLIGENYTDREHLFAMGGSAGGLLMGAVVNMRPDLFKGIIAAVPWVDVVTTMLDESIPLTTSEFDEWGNPKNKTYYDYMLSYSPYDNVKARDYPAMYVTTGLHDSQVQYFEPAKWVAKLRSTKTDSNLLVLEVDMSSGHGGASGRFKQYERTAREYAFMLYLLKE